MPWVARGSLLIPEVKPPVEEDLKGGVTISTDAIQKKRMGELKRILRAELMDLEVDLIKEMERMKKEGKKRA